MPKGGSAMRICRNLPGCSAFMVSANSSQNQRSVERLLVMHFLFEKRMQAFFHSVSSNQRCQMAGWLVSGKEA